MMKRLILFDIDGTILWTNGAGRSAIRRALAEELDVDKPFGGVRFDGKTDPQIVREILEAANHPDPHNEDHIAAVCARYVELLQQELDSRRQRVRVFPGVREVLRAIEERSDMVLGLLTGNIERGAHLKLVAAGLEPGRFSVGAFGSDASHRPDLPAIAVGRVKQMHGWEPRGQDVVIVGDTPADMTCGNGIGARAIGVATGSYSVEELRVAGGDVVFESLEPLDHVLEAVSS
jgi:phosphoglycolate phosphatase-like HAD superfamily hydrolase